MRISARADYAVRSALELAAAPAEAFVKAEQIAAAQAIPVEFLEAILGQLRRAGIVESHRGPDGGFRLLRPAGQVTLADVLRAVDGPIARVRGGPPEQSGCPGPARALPRVWIALRQNLRSVAEHVTLAEIASDSLPGFIERLSAEPEAWLTRPIPSPAPRSAPPPAATASSPPIAPAPATT